jgi:hypothetical protein
MWTREPVSVDAALAAGSVLSSGDLYHYPGEITYKTNPNFDTNAERTAKSREMIEDLVQVKR